MGTTQQHLPVKDIRGGIVLLKNGGGSLILQTTSFNFGLLSELEQVAIIYSFAQMLNSLSFPIQIIIRSKRLDITSYVHLLDRALKEQANPLLSKTMLNYRNFVVSLIKESEVLDKKFYVAISVSSLEIGFRLPDEERIKEIKATLEPRRDQIVRVLNRVGLKSKQLTDRELVQLLFGIYNPAPVQSDQLPSLEELKVNTFTPTPTPLPQPIQSSQPVPEVSFTETRVAKNHPFVVEELGE